MDAFYAAVEERYNPQLRGRPIVVGADPKEGHGRGVVTARTGLFQPAVLVQDVPRFTAPSVYGAWGDWFAWLCVLTSAALLAASARASRQGTGGRVPLARAAMDAGDRATS